MTALIEARHVTKVFGGGMFSRGGGLVAVDDLSLAIEEALAAEAGNQSKAARRLGISERALRYKLAKIRESD